MPFLNNIVLVSPEADRQISIDRINIRRGTRRHVVKKFREETKDEKPILSDPLRCSKIIRHSLRIIFRNSSVNSSSRFQVVLPGNSNTSLLRNLTVNINYNEYSRASILRNKFLELCESMINK